MREENYGKETREEARQGNERGTREGNERGKREAEGGKRGEK